MQTARPQVQYRPRPSNLSLERIMEKSAARNPSDASQGPRGTIPGMAGHTRGYAQRIDVAADLQRVWRALTNTEDLTRWCSPGAAISPRPGGLFRASVDRVTELDAHIDIFEPGRRLRLIYLPTPTLPPSESAVVDDFILDADDDGTVMRLLGSGYPADPAWDAHYLRLRVGWERAVARLKVWVERQSKSGA
jgi:uncharacterized protein YndB with AHSA1/START domain